MPVKAGVDRSLHHPPTEANFGQPCDLGGHSGNRSAPGLLAPGKSRHPLRMGAGGARGRRLLENPPKASALRLSASPSAYRASMTEGRAARSPVSREPLAQPTARIGQDDRIPAGTPRLPDLPIQHNYNTDTKLRRDGHSARRLPLTSYGEVFAIG